MDPMKLEKFEAMNDYSKNMHQSSGLKNHLKSNNNAFSVYILTALACSLVFLSPFWYPSVESLITSLPNLIPNLVTPKCLFIVGNLIVFVLVGESKLHTSKSSQEPVTEEYYHEYISQSRSLKQQKSFTSDHNTVVQNQCMKITDVRRSSSVNGSRLKPIRKVDSIKREVCGSKASVVRSLSAEELSKRADDFIARVNRQRRIEYSSC